MNIAERWQPVVGYEGLYEVSDLGRVKSLPRKDRLGRSVRGGILKGTQDHYGYLVINLLKDGKPRQRKIHQVVVEAFLGPCTSGHEVRHLNGHPADNALINLAYGSRGDNNLDAVRHGTHPYARRTHCAQGHLFDEDNTFIRSRGGRGCRKCRRENKQKSRARARG